MVIRTPYKIKIFQGYKVEEQFNEWSDQHEMIEIVDMQHKYDANTYHTLIILYFEVYEVEAAENLPGMPS